MIDRDDLNELSVAVRDAASRGEACDAVAALYRAVQQEVDARRPRCDLSGRCCRFEEYGHRLYVTTLEMAAFVREVGKQWPVVSGKLPVKARPADPLAARYSPAATVIWDGAGCPFQAGKLCGVHSIRPFGCRMFFCDPTATDWQHQAYERFHAELKRLHASHGVPYFYVEWGGALRSLGLAAEGARDDHCGAAP